MFLTQLVLGVGASALLLAPPPGSGVWFGRDDGGCIANEQPSYTVGSIQVAQESQPGLGDFDANVLGSMLPYQTVLACNAFYGYVPSASSYSGCYVRFDLAENRSHLYAAQMHDGMGLVIIHDRADNSDGGSAEMIFELSGDPNGARRTIEDDPGDFYVGEGGSTIFESSNSWGSCCTDGFVLGGLDGAWSMTVEFGEVDDPWSKQVISGLESWFACSADGSEIELVLEEGRAVRFQYIPTCDADVVQDGTVGICDLLKLVGSWGACF